MTYYLTYYEAYPIYEPAEGGYYYEGRTAIQWWESENLNEILNSISDFAKDFGMEKIPFDFDDIKDELEK